MEAYSHGPFQVTGYHVTIPSLEQEEQMIMEAWMEINDTPHDELPRSYGYDLDMYNADGTEVTVAISVKK